MANKGTDVKIIHITLLCFIKATKKRKVSKKLATDMYFEGLGFLGIGCSAVYYRVKELDVKSQGIYNINLTQYNQEINLVELKKIHSHTKHKNHNSP